MSKPRQKTEMTENRDIYKDLAAFLLQGGAFAKVGLYAEAPAERNGNLLFHRKTGVADESFPPEMVVERAALKDEPGGIRELQGSNGKRMFCLDAGNESLVIAGIPGSDERRVEELCSLGLLYYRMLREKSDLSGRLAEQRNKYALLLEILQIVHSSLDINDVLQRIIQNSNLLFEAEASSVLLLDENGKSLVFEVATGMAGKSLKRKKLAVGRGIAGWVAEKQNPLIVNDVRSDERFCDYYDSMSGFKTRSVLAAPITREGRLLGVAESVNKRDGKDFTENDLELFAALCKQAGVAVDKARNYANEKKRKEKIGRLYDSLTLEKAKRDTILESITSGVMVLGTDMSIQYMNARAVEMVGSREISLQKRKGEEKWQSELKRILGKVVHDGKALQTNLEMKDNIYRANVIPVRYFEELDSIAVVIEEITELYKLNEVKTNFISHLSHELKTPLTSINGAVELLRKGRKNGLEKKEKKLLFMIEQDCRNMKALIGDVLDLAKIEAGLIEISREKISVSKVFSKAAEIAAPAAERKDAVIINLISDGLPPVCAGETMMYHVFGNLLSNAVKYSPPGGKIIAEAFRKDEINVQVTITDQGEGIRPDEREKVFEKFYQGTCSRYSDEKSTGLGLSICKSIIESFGGTIWVENPETVRSRTGLIRTGASVAFTLKIPLNESKGENDE